MKDCLASFGDDCSYTPYKRKVHFALSPFQTMKLADVPYNKASPMGGSRAVPRPLMPHTPRRPCPRPWIARPPAGVCFGSALAGPIPHARGRGTLAIG